MTVSRRNLLKSGLLVAGALTSSESLGGFPSVAGAASNGTAARTYSWAQPVVRRQPDSLPFPALPAGTDTIPQIEHIVVVMMENHSYDNYLGMLRRGDGFTLGTNGRPVNTNPTPNPGLLQRAFHMPNHCQQDAKPAQDWLDSHIQYDRGMNDGFVRSNSGPVAMGYWKRSDIPFYYSLAAIFPLADRWFSPLLGQTIPQRRYLTAGTSAGMVNDDLSQIGQKPPNGTIFERLEQHGIPWRDYYHTKSNPTTDMWITDPSASSPNNVPINSFFTDAASGHLPGFAIVDPHFGYQSEEDPQDIAIGEAFVSRVIRAVMKGPAWSKTLLVWAYDEHGGYYDHVPPPPAIAPDSIPPNPPSGQSKYEGFHRYGFRVPAVIVSPFAKRNFVSSAIYDHTSILAMVERKWNLPALTYRDANAKDLMHFLDLKQPGFVDPPVLAQPATSPSSCTPGSAGTIPPPGSVIPANAASSSTG